MTEVNNDGKQSNENKDINDSDNSGDNKKIDGKNDEFGGELKRIESLQGLHHLESQDGSGSEGKSQEKVASTLKSEITFTPTSTGGSIISDSPEFFLGAPETTSRKQRYQSRRSRRESRQNNRMIPFNVTVDQQHKRSNSFVPIYGSNSASADDDSFLPPPPPPPPPPPHQHHYPPHTRSKSQFMYQYNQQQQQQPFDTPNRETIMGFFGDSQISQRSINGTEGFSPNPDIVKSQNYNNYNDSPLAWSWHKSSPDIFGSQKEFNLSNHRRIQTDDPSQPRRLQHEQQLKQQQQLDSKKMMWIKQHELQHSQSERLLVSSQNQNLDSRTAWLRALQSSRHTPSPQSRDSGMFPSLSSFQQQPTPQQEAIKVVQCSGSVSSIEENSEENDQVNNEQGDGSLSCDAKINHDENLESEHQQHQHQDLNGDDDSIPNKVLRVKNSPFANMGKSTEKADRRRFMPMTSFVGDDPIAHPTYVCPRCKTKQREFFTVNNAPRQFESASGYVAFYFGIYVIAALYIFGLEEGWPALDCIYFAVITLTTAGLGDLVPTSDSAKIICSVFIYFGVACIGLLLGSYIAGMLDEVSSQEAKANRIKSCPNCARIQTIKDAAERRHRTALFHHSIHGGASLSTSAAAAAASSSSRHNHTYNEHISLEHNAKKFKRVHHTPSKVRHNQNSSAVMSEGVPQNRNWGVNSIQPNAASGLPPLAGGMPANHNVSSVHNFSPNSPAISPTKAQSFLGSPLTAQILGRQSHTRHASLDLSAFGISETSLRGGFGGTRTFSADIPSTIEEGAAFDATAAESPHPPPPPPVQVWNVESIEGDDTIDHSSDSEDSFSSDSSSYESDDEIDDQFSKVKNAKYVFLTLREALVNSLVIIVFGCLGFVFIEGFSLVDSWYFTTVLLTTVGYGDIVPATKGGKLFATVYILVAGTILLNNMSMISMIPLELRKRRIERAVLTQFGDQLDDAALQELATGPLIQRLHLSAQRPGGLDECTREMFALAMLVRLGKVTEQDIRSTFAAFRRLDVNNDGVLNSKSIIAGMIQKRRTSAIGNSQRHDQHQRRHSGGITRSLRDKQFRFSGPCASPPPPPCAENIRSSPRGEHFRFSEPVITPPTDFNPYYQSHHHHPNETQEGASLLPSYDHASPFAHAQPDYQSFQTQ